VSFRVRKRVKELMRLVNIDWRSEIERFIEEKAKKLLREQLLRESEKFLERMNEIPNYELLRESRDEK